MKIANPLVLVTITFMLMVPVPTYAKGNITKINRTGKAINNKYYYYKKFQLVKLRNLVTLIKVPFFTSTKRQKMATQPTFGLNIQKQSTLGSTLRRFHLKSVTLIKHLRTPQQKGLNGQPLISTTQSLVPIPK